LLLLILLRRLLPWLLPLATAVPCLCLLVLCLAFSSPRLLLLRLALSASPWVLSFALASRLLPLVLLPVNLASYCRTTP
jgi:hypothetical protein